LEKTESTNHKWWVLVAVGIGTFMTALDSSVVNTILPILRHSLNSDVAGIEWVVTVYLLTLSGLLLSFGRLGDLRGHKTIYLSGFGLFVASSALCGLAPSVEILVISRITQAVGAAMLMANSPAILTKNFPAQQRGQALGLQATMTYLGLTVGPSLGGWLANQFGWRVVFYINIPVGILALWVSLRFIPYDTPEKITERFDLPGAGAFIGGLVALLLALNQGHHWGWTSPQVLGLLAAAVLLLWAFIHIESHSPTPMLDLSLFRRPIFTLSVASAVFNYICLYSVIFLLPHYLIDGRGLNSAQAGLLLTAQPIVMAIVAPFSGTFSDRIGVRLPATLGMSLLAGGILLLSRLGSASPWIQIILSLAVVGLGIGIFVSPNNSAVMGAAPPHRQGIAAGVLATARSFGMVLGVGFAGAIYTTVLARGSLAYGSVAAPTLFPAIQASFLAAAIFAILGIFTSALRREGSNNGNA
jgi:EmrB/QacA subfamily drug resistance transporter